MKKTLRVFTLLVSIAMPMLASASDFFSTEEPVSLFNIGVRVGVNTSNRTLSNPNFNYWNVNSWGTGFDAGAVVNINFKDYLSVQPGFFYQCRTGDYAYASYSDADGEEPNSFVQLGHIRTYDFIIPVVASLHFNVSDNVRWNVDFGPYLDIRLYNNAKNSISVDPLGEHPNNYAKSSGCDFGFKMGTGLNICRHYYVGVHYLAGCTHVWKNGLDGHNKIWSFTVGYDF